jgi:hypothetical protein
MSTITSATIGSARRLGGVIGSSANATGNTAEVQTGLKNGGPIAKPDVEVNRNTDAGADIYLAATTGRARSIPAAGGARICSAPAIAGMEPPGAAAGSTAKAAIYTATRNVITAATKVVIRLALKAAGEDKEVTPTNSATRSDNTPAKDRRATGGLTIAFAKKSATLSLNMAISTLPK